MSESESDDSQSERSGDIETDSEACSGSSEPSRGDDYLSGDFLDAEWRQKARALQQKEVLTGTAAAGDDDVAVLVKPKTQIGIAAFAVKKAEDPDKYDRIMKDNAAADAARRASMPTKDELAEQKLQRKRAQQSARQAKRRLKIKLAKSTKEDAPKKRVHIELGAATQCPELPADASKQPKRIKRAAYGRKGNQQADGAGKGAGEGARGCWHLAQASQTKGSQNAASQSPPMQQATKPKSRQDGANHK
jgi:hypothetical protein